MHSSKYHSLIFLILFPVLLVLNSGCNRQAQPRSYEEIRIESEKAAAPHALSSSEDLFAKMPQDDIHAGLTQEDLKKLLPQDDIHAGVTPEDLQKLMPMDEIHARLRSKTNDMPDDAVHAGLKDPSMKTQDPMVKQALEASVDRSPLTWDTPQGWEEKKGQGMRLVTFFSTDDASSVECSIISLAGAAGGQSANVARWMRQINLDPPSDLENYIATLERFNTRGGLPAILVDLTSFQSSAKPDSPSLIAAIIEKDDAQVFVKMTGTKQAVQKYRQNLIDLTQSIQSRN